MVEQGLYTAQVVGSNPTPRTKFGAVVELVDTLHLECSSSEWEFESPQPYQNKGIIMLGHDEPITFEHMMDLIDRLKSEMKYDEDLLILTAIEESVWRYNDLLD